MKTRVMLSQHHKSLLADFVEAGRKIMAIDGPLGFYRGFSASLLLSSNGAI
jgi:hypothetical protein